MKNLTKLLALGLLVVGLSSCGVDSTKFEETDTGEEVTTQTNKNDIDDLAEQFLKLQEDIDSCEKDLNHTACERAESQGYENAPLFFDDIQNAQSISFDGMSFNKINEDTSWVKFERVYLETNSNLLGGNSRDMKIKQHVIIYDDNSVETRAWYKWHQGTIQFSWTASSEIQPGTPSWLVDLFNGIVHETGIEWQTIDANEFWLGNERATVTSTSNAP